MPRLICSVHGCALPLVPAGDVLRCPTGHAFDRAREGYWNLLQPQDRRSLAAGDRLEAVLARRRWLERGFVEGLVETVAHAARFDALPTGAVVLDVGCGDGWFDARLTAGCEVDLCGIDLSAGAAGLAARRLPRGTWVVANADRGLPLATGSVDLAFSIFGRRPAQELARVVRPGGRLVAAVPAEDDLAELREATQGRAIPRDRVAGLAADLAATPFCLSSRTAWRRQAQHDRAAIDDVLAMTYRGARQRERERLHARLDPAERLDVTLAAEVVAFDRAPAAPGSRDP